MRATASCLLAIGAVLVVLGLRAGIAASGDDPARERVTGQLFSADERLPARPSPGFPSREGTGASGQAVIGTDDRVRILETDIYPWRAIAYLEIYDELGEISHHCTGTFVGPDAMLTAAHCLYDDATGFVGDIAVVPGKDGDYEPYGFEFATNWWVPDPWIDTGGDADWDWGVIKMANGSLGSTVGWLRIANLRTATLEAPDFMPAIVGYPAGVMPEATMWGSIQNAFELVDLYELYHVIDTAPGQSGSAVFSANIEGPNLGDIVGIHTSALTGVNRAVRIEEITLADIRYACEVMLCSIAEYTEPEPEPLPIRARVPGLRRE